LAKVFPSPVVQTLVQSALQMLDDGVSLRHKYDEPITVRLSVVEGMPVTVHPTDWAIQSHGEASAY
jgi:hypothetical protein